MTSSKQIASSLLKGAECIAVIPGLTKAGFIVGGLHGNGVVSCRTSTAWSAPAFISMSGGSVGFQAGGEHQDIVLLMNKQGEQELRNGHWDLGADATAAGPTGASAGAGESTGWKAPVLSYTHSSGAYAGANLQGSKINADQDTMHNLYRDSLPGAIIAVTTWVGLSCLLATYFRHFDGLNKTYGVLGAAIALYAWFYLSGIAILFGGEVNCLLREHRHHDAAAMTLLPPASAHLHQVARLS